MTISIPPTTAEKPDATLSGWTVFEVDAPGIGHSTFHLVGFNEREGLGRVSSPVEQLDVRNRTGVTRSGSVYRLSGHPGLGGDATYTWELWQRLWRVSVPRDVTQEFVEEFAAARICNLGSVAG